MKLALKMLGTLLATAVAFYVGFVGRGIYFQRYVVPGLVKQSPHDGQIGLENFTTSLDWGAVAAAIVLVTGIVLTIRSTRRPAHS